MKTHTFLTGILFAIASLCASAPANTIAPRPNILLILADDLGWSDIGCYGGEIHTPVLDALARDGIKFTQFYNSARCCPTRASLLTGLYPHQAGVGEMTHDRGPDHPGYRGTLQPNTVTLAEALRQAGYATFMVGKWHLRNAKTDIKPTDRGFDEFYGMLGGFNSCWQESPWYTRWPQDRTPRTYTSATNGNPGTFYSTDVFADYALDFMVLARQQKRPFFLYLAFNAPHFPLHAHAADIAKYESLYFEKGWDVIRQERLSRLQRLGMTPPDLALTPRSPIPAKSHAQKSSFAGKDNPAWDTLPEDRRRDLARRMAVYAAMVDRMDQAIGRVVEDLKKNTEMDNTLILFLSDNGACWEWDPYGFDTRSGPENILHTGADLEHVGGPDSYVSYGSGWANAGNTPWRLYKHFCHEGGIRTPFIVHWPAGLKNRQKMCAQPGHIIDIMPTLLAVSGATYPEKRDGIDVCPPEGCSLLPTFEDQFIQRHTPLFFEHDGSRAVRDGQWKLVSPHGDAWELYDLGADPTEMNNLVAKEPERAQQMVAAWTAWAQRCHVDSSKSPSPSKQTSTPHIANQALTIRCAVVPEAREGVILAHGGRQHGYALYFINGRLTFGVRIDGELFTASTHDYPRGRIAIEARLAADGAMTLALNGTTAATAHASGLIPVQPQDGLSVNKDTLSPVGEYTAPQSFKGAVENIDIQTSPAPPETRWTKERAAAWHAQQPFRAGANFSPSTAGNQIEMWRAETFDPATIDRELGYAQKLGFNSMRVFLHDLLWLHDPQGLLDRMDQYLRMADRHGIQTMFVLFDSCWNPYPTWGQQPEPRPRTHNALWAQSPGMDVLLNPDRQAHLKLYVQGVLRRFSKDPRVLAWDIWNEPDNVDGGQRDTPREPHNKAELVLPLLKEAFVWARGVNPTQPLTSAVWRHPHDVDTQDPVKRFQLEQSDIISFHCYGPTPYFQQTARALQSLGRPLICTEYMARENGGAFDPLLGWMRDQKIGAYCWDFVNGRTQTIYPVRSWRQPFTNEPAIWNTCLLRADGSSYRQNETDYIHAVMTRRD